ncbi:XRE family transcriptional regulator [Sphingomonas changnyeongensis]|uniref:XRE family transcriptional regulator n=1 Tax=Sphingomonas changnyeongensis TaxID=2698679 RepID=A0A7Z2S6W8_9SPHN|nr:helix-turn-helix transcriptional regulator [Sphingomonas changnyeongensis]QHL89731.1 XRE family transcriptional regulator [Sphingomonas changnyeongensis]
MRRDESASGGGAEPCAIRVDPHRLVVFPNRIRDLRRTHGQSKLLALSARLPAIPYIRLSKIERGEVVARADELRAIAAAIGVEAVDLLIDIDAPDFDIARWAEPFQDGGAFDAAEEGFAVKLAAAVRTRRAGDRALTVAVLDRDYGIAPVILSRIENAHKTLDRWNAATVGALCRLMTVRDEGELRALVEAQYRAGALDAALVGFGDPEARRARMRARIAALVAELGGAAAPGPYAGGNGGSTAGTDRIPASPEPHVRRRAIAPPPLPAPPPPSFATIRLVPVFGAPRADGLIDPVIVPGALVEAPRHAGPRAFGLRACRPSLGAGLPGHGVLIVDPDAYPFGAGLAVLREDDGYRLLQTSYDLAGAMRGHSLNPPLDLALDGTDPARLAAVLAVIFP